jgi:glycosyltransferase involved in cell wall biosynthesis
MLAPYDSQLVKTWRQRLNRLGSIQHHPPRPVLLPTRYLADDNGTAPLSVSIVTATLNQSRFLEGTIASVLSQGYRRIEYTVQDGASSDQTPAILARHSDRISWESSSDSGLGQALNRGFVRTSGEIMAYLNSDDLLLPGTVSYVSRYLSVHPDVDAVYGHRILIDAQGLEIGRHVLPPHSDRVLAWADFIPQETLFWRRSIWEAAGARFDEALANAIDWELLLRLRTAGARIVRLPRFLGAFRVHPAQKTQAGEALSRAEMGHLRRRQHGRPVSQREVLRRVRPYLLRHVVCDRLYRMGLLRY